MRLVIGLLLAALASFASVPASAQGGVSLYCWSTSQPPAFVPCSSTNPLQVQGSISASLSPFTPALSGARGTPVAVTTADSSGTLPTNTGSVIVSNVGTNPMYCNVNGVAATTSDQLITSGGGWFNFGVPVGATTLHCIATGGSTTANTVGGVGLGAGTGGGSGGGGGGGGAVFGPTANGSPAANPPVLVGGTIDGTATGNVSNLKVVAGVASAALNATPSLANGNGVVPTQGGTALSATNGQFTNLLQGNAVLASGNPLFAQLTTGAATIGALVANQSVNNSQVNGVTMLTGNGVTGTGSQRVTVASDNTPFAVKIDQTTPGTTNLVSIGTNGTVNPTTAANWGIGTSTQNSSTVANGHLVLGQFNTTPTTVTSGNMSPLQMDNAGNLLVNIKAGSSSGAVAQGSTTSGQTGPLVQCAVTTSAPTYTTAQTNPLSCVTDGSLRTTVVNTNANITPGDGITTTTYGAGSPVIGVDLLWNGTTYDRHKSAGATGIAAVGGAGASGSALSGNPVLSAGSDGTNARSLSTDTAGHVNTNAAFNVTATDCSGTVTTGGTAVNAFTAQTTLHGFTIANIDTSEPMWISFTTTAAASGTGSYPIPAAAATTFAGFGSFTSPSGFGLNHALSVIATTSAHKFTCTWW